MTPNTPEDKLPAYVYAAASAARMLGMNLWTLPAADQDRVILAALDALPVMPEGVQRDLQNVSEDDYFEIFEAARVELMHIWNDLHAADAVD